MSAAGGTQDASLVGQTIGELEVTRLLAQGSMGEVYLARSTRNGALVALKVLRDDWRGDASAVKRFEREASVLGRLEHPSIVRVREFGALASGWPFLAMEYVDGVDLLTRVSRDGPLAVPDALRLLLRIANALEYAHREKVVHRDLKPGNVILRGDDPAQATLIDFGLVKVLSDAFLARLTADREVLGSPHFMAPEQTRGEAALGPPADVYALGGVAYFALSGRSPFGELPLLQLVTAHMQRTPERLSARVPGIPPLLDGVLFACLAKRPDERPHADEIVAHLGNLVRTTPWAGDLS